MRISIFLIVLTLLSCNSNVTVKESLSEDSSYKESLNSIYDFNYKPTGFQTKDFEFLQDLSNEFPERLDTVPNNIMFRLISKDTSSSTLLCRSISFQKDCYLGIFVIRRESKEYKLFVTFSTKGEPIDYLTFKSAAKGQKDSSKKWDRFYSNVVFYSCNNCTKPYIDSISVNILDTSEKVIHPHLANVLNTDSWQIDESGKFYVD
jgi:hypothetical protein